MIILMIIEKKKNKKKRKKKEKCVSQARCYVLYSNVYLLTFVQTLKSVKKQAQKLCQRLLGAINGMFDKENRPIFSIYISQYAAPCQPNTLVITTQLGDGFVIRLPDSQL